MYVLPLIGKMPSILVRVEKSLVVYVPSAKVSDNSLTIFPEASFILLSAI